MSGTPGRHFRILPALLVLAVGCGGGAGGSPAVPPGRKAGPGEVRIVVASTRGCVNTPPTLRRIRETAQRLSARVKVETVVVSTKEEAVRFRFHGSPTVLVEGEELDPAMRGRRDYGFT